MCAAVAEPWLIRKLQCISETCASPMAQSTATGGIDQLPGLAPGGFLKVDPPVRVLTGCVEERASVIVFMSARIATGSPTGRRTKLGEDDVVGHARNAGR